MKNWKKRGAMADDGSFTAYEVLAKHDENYMPPQAQQALDQAKKNHGGSQP